MDTIEREYEREIQIACSEGDTDKAHELSIGLSEYRSEYKVERDE